MIFNARKFYVFVFFSTPFILIFFLTFILHISFFSPFRGRGFRLQALFDSGIDIDCTNEYGQSALFLAAANGHSRTVSLLLCMGACCVKDNAGVCVVFNRVDGSGSGSRGGSNSNNNNNNENNERN